jgi:hypothetical protein
MVKKADTSDVMNIPTMVEVESTDVALDITESEMDDLIGRIKDKGFAFRIKEITIGGGVTIPTGDKGSYTFAKGDASMVLQVGWDPQVPGTVAAMSAATNMAREWVNKAVRANVDKMKKMKV